MIRVIFNQKGGVGKSSISCNLAAVSAFRGNSTLLIDLDPQCNSTSYLLGRNVVPDLTIADFFESTLSFNIFQRKPEDFIEGTRFEKLSVLAASPSLDVLERKLETKHKIYKLKELLEKLTDQFEHIFIDTAPALNFYTQSALIAADSCIIPFDCDDFSRQSLYKIIEDIRELQVDHNPDLEIEGIVANQFLSQASLPKRLIEELEQENLPVLPVKLSSSVKMKESHQASEPLIYLDKKHKLTQQFVELFEFLENETTVAS